MFPYLCNFKFLFAIFYLECSPGQVYDYYLKCLDCPKGEVSVPLLFISLYSVVE